MAGHDHELTLATIWEGTPTWTLECVHGETDRFYVDADGNEYDECLVETWFDAEGIEIVHTGLDHPALTLPLPLWTHYVSSEGYPELVPEVIHRERSDDPWSASRSVQQE